MRTKVFRYHVKERQWPASVDRLARLLRSKGIHHEGYGIYCSGGREISGSTFINRDASDDHVSFDRSVCNSSRMELLLITIRREVKPKVSS